MPFDLTTAELAEYLRENPGMIPLIANHDPRVRLMEMLDGDPEASKAIRAHTKRLRPNARVLEVDLPAEFDTKLKERDDKIAALQKRLDDGETSTRWTAFRAKLRRFAADAEDVDEAAITDEAVDTIVAFMKDNDFGEKSAAIAVQKFYETKEPARPTSTWAPSPLRPEGGGDYTKKLFAASPDADLMDLAMPDIERIFHEEFSGSPQRRRPQLA